jgi:hypothetical protein
VHSSTSSSDQRLPHAEWGKILLGAMILFVAFVGVMELRLAARGFRPTVIDSEARWLKQRERASDLGSRALVLVGASRMQLDVDLDVLRRETGLEPVQLAIDGSDFSPVLEGLADDPSIRGTVLVDYNNGTATGVAGGAQDIPGRYKADYESLRLRHHLPDFADTEAWLTDVVHDHMRSYADGANPLTSLLTRIVPPRATPQYLITLPDRSRMADYKKVSMPDFYYARAIRNLGTPLDLPPNVTYPELDKILQSHIDALAPASMQPFAQRAHALDAMADAIRARGGHVAFLVMPMSGFVKDIDSKKYPRAQFWDAFTASTSAQTLNSDDVANLRTFTCPDGSHLDYRDRAKFTHELVKALELGESAGRNNRPTPAP